MYYRTALCVLLVLSSIPLAADQAQGKCPYPLFPELYEAVKGSIDKGDGSSTIAGIDKKLSETIKGKPLKQAERLEQLFILRAAAERFPKTSDKKLARYLLNKPEILGRFFHALDEEDNFEGAMRVLRQLKDFDDKKFEKMSELCIAYAVVWDKFRGHYWVDRHTKMEEGTMLATYKHYCKNSRVMLIPPSKIPFELGIYVVGTRLREDERGFIRNTYPRTPLSPRRMYGSVPWTLNDAKTLSPAHGKGLDTPYTLMNIKKIGGCCMDQGYYVENVFRILGVPAVYTTGRGKRGGHAWAGVLRTKPNIHWDFSSGRYTYDHYYKGAVSDPTDMRKKLTDSVVKMTTALFTASSLKKVERSYYYVDAAKWAETHLPEKIEGDKPVEKKELVKTLLSQSLEASPYNDKAWFHLSALASQGKIEQDTAMYWAQKLFDLTVKSFPDFTLDCMQRFLSCVNDNKKKAEIYGKMYKVLRVKRADLACDIKVLEGDVWLAEGEVARAILAYVYPIANFSNDAHVLEKAKERIESIGSKVKDEKELEKAYLQIVKAASRKKKMNEMTMDIVDMVVKNLATIYRKNGENKKAERLEKMFRK